MQSLFPLGTLVTRTLSTYTYNIWKISKYTEQRQGLLTIGDGYSIHLIGKFDHPALLSWMLSLLNPGLLPGIRVLEYLACLSLGWHSAGET